MSDASKTIGAAAGVGKHVVGYERFIDGLRAIAVVSVILFHLFPNVVGGGFVGVDIFFVISGYLITGQIRQQGAAGTFQIGSFYARRIRRITPALIVMLVASACAAILILRPEDMWSFAKSLLAQPLSLQNFVFLAEGEYFRGADTKPLLHTWTLAVEEQFYLCWPLLLLAVRRARWSSVLSVLLALIIGSFVLNDVLVALSPKASFFLLPTRAWELAIGGLAAVLHEHRRHAWTSQKVQYSLASVAGVVLLLFSILWIKSSLPFPGNVAVLPVLGCFLVLLFGGQGWLVKRILNSRPLVSVGLISYPLYLWHWPILTYMRYLRLSTSSVSGMALFAVVTIGLSVASTRYVETPIRRREVLSRTRTLYAVVAGSLATVVLLAIHLLQTQGALYRYDPQARPFLAASFDARDARCGFFYRSFHPRSEVCELVAPGASSRRVMLWGNSHADMWSGALLELARTQGAALFVNAKNCRGTIDSSFCNQSVQSRTMEEVQVRRATDVILASTWHTSYGIPDGQFEKQLGILVGRLCALGTRVWLVIDVPVAPQFDPVSAWRANPIAPIAGVLPKIEYARQHDRELRFFDALRAAHSELVHIIDVQSVYCDEVRCMAGRDGQVWYRDDGHLTNTGARAGIRKFDPVFLP